MRFCQKHGYKMKIVNPLWLITGMKSPNCDIHIYTRRYVYSVKLCGSVLKRITVTFFDAETYSVKRLIPFVSQTYGDVGHKKKLKKPYNFKYKLDNEAYSKISCPILLMCPVATQVYRMEGTKRITVGNGDDIGECTFYTKSGFIRKLENDSFDFEYRE